MNRAPLIVMAIVLVLIGPAMFVIARMRALDVGIASLHAGESPAQVVSVLGEPQQQVRLAPPARADFEYRYRAWPLPRTWEVDFRAGHVVGAVRR